MGSNMAEAHPVGFRWPMKAKERGGKLIHVDPRFSRTSAMADTHVQIRAGSDIAFLGALIRWVIENDRCFTDYVKAYTNASTLIDAEWSDTEDADGIFSGWNPATGDYDLEKGHWAYQREAGFDPASLFPHADPDAPRQDSGATASVSLHASPKGKATAGPVQKDETLQHPRCVFQLLRKHFGRYTPEVAASICGCTPEQIVQVAQQLADNSGRERTSAICYAVGWTQHSTGPQIIRAASVLQLLLGNIGRPGGGIMALRGHCSIQGSTDVPTLYDLLPGYLPQPSHAKTHQTLDGYCEHEGVANGYWCNFRKFIVSMLKSWYGSAATPDNDFRFNWLPRIDRDYSMLPFFDQMTRGEVEGYFVIGQNPAAGGPNGGLMRAGLRQLKWLVVMDWFETETACFWRDDPKGPPSAEVGTEVFFLPCASSVEKEGTFTNTQRLIQWHDKAVDPPGDCRADLWWIYQLGRRLKQLYAGSDKLRDQPIQHLTWDYEPRVPPLLPDGSLSRIEGDPDADAVLREMNGYVLDEQGRAAHLISGFDALKHDGSTSSGCWIYSGVYPHPGQNRARSRRRVDNPVEPEWGFAWPKNRRVMYNRASADPAGKPWSERKKLLWWSEELGKWQGPDVPDFPEEKRPDYRPAEGAKGMDAIAGDSPFILQGDGKGWLYAAGGATKDAPFPTHYEPVESPVHNALYTQATNPTVRRYAGPLNPLAEAPTPDFPVVGCTFRVTEHYLSGAMSRFNSWLNELMPAMFVEISPELASQHGIENGGWCTVTSPRGELEARALVTRRQRPMTVMGQTVHQIGIPFHWSYAGEAVGGAANDLTSLAADPNVTIHEAKVFVCRIRAGRCAGQPTLPTVPTAPWPLRSPTPNTRASAQPEGYLLKNVRKDGPSVPSPVSPDEKKEPLS